MSVVTKERPESRARRQRMVEFVGYVLVAAAFVLIGLGIFEIGGLFNVGLGLVLVVVGAPMMFVRPEEEPLLGEEEFLRQLRDL